MFCLSISAHNSVYMVYYIQTSPLPLLKTRRDPSEVHSPSLRSASPAGARTLSRASQADMEAVLDDVKNGETSTFSLQKVPISRRF